MSRSRTALLLSGSLLLILGMLWGQGVFSAVSPPPPTVGTPVAQPSVLMVNQTTQQTVTSRITSSPGHPVVPASVKLERVDAQGAIVANLGTMYDDGTHGDAVAGDGIFTVQGSLRETTPGTLRLQVAATFRAGPGRITSAIALIPIVTQTNTPPVANAGPDQTVVVGTTVQLDGSKSSDVDGDVLRFQWSFLARPSGSMATLSNPTAVHSTFLVDRPGPYRVQLIVNDGQVDSAPATVDISTQNSRPVANAGPDQTVFVSDTVQLHGSQSSDVDGDTLSYRWSFISTPAASLATFDDSTAVHPTFVVDYPGTYMVQLIVNDGTVDSAPDTAVISTQNSRPVADVGPNQTVAVGATVQLDGSQSSDVDGDPLTFRWALTVLPEGSTATLSDVTAEQPTFVGDRPGTYVAQLIVNDGHVDSAPATTTIKAGVPPRISLNPADGALLNTTTPLLTTTYQDPGSGIDLTSLRVTLDGVDVTARFTITATQATYQATLADGVHQLAVSLRNLVGLGAQATARLTIDTLPPPLIPQTSLTVGLVTNGQVTITGAPGSTEGGALVTLVNTRTGQKVQVRATAAGGFTAVLAAQQGDGVNLTSTDAAGNTSASTMVTVGVPPDPATVAPPLDRSVATDLATATAFLYTGPTPLQTGVAPGTFAPQRVAVLRGQVLDRTGAALPGVQISILQHPEFGQTLSRVDGMFDLAVNGGGLLTVVYQKDGVLPAQRQIQTPWRNYAWLPDAVLLPYDSHVTRVDLSAPGFRVAQGSVSTDASGTRQATLLFAPGTQATMHLPDGSTQALTTLHVRVTEHSVGDTGPQSVAAEEPSTVAYTYGVDFTAEEALAAQALALTFSQPVILYVQNFIGFPVGGGVPVGGYENSRGLWVPQPNGRVVKVLQVTGGQATVDVTGGGQAASPAALAALGITGPELQQVALLYSPGQMLWRVPIPHFSYWDA